MGPTKKNVLHNNTSNVVDKPLKLVLFTPTLRSFPPDNSSYTAKSKEKSKRNCTDKSKSTSL